LGAILLRAASSVFRLCISLEAAGCSHSQPSQGDTPLKYDE
jgi:hypothetical protein